MNFSVSNMVHGIALSLALLSSPDAKAESKLESSILRAQERGIEIFIRDQVAWRATEAAFPVGLRRSGAIGWITVHKPRSWLVRFVKECGQLYCSVIDVNIKKDEPDSAVLLDPPAPLSIREQTA